ncbi:MAG: hypothetical protein PHW14_04020 [Candidatus Omnitrophica bacterium]|nr:hypothetical protein [Candidatus Omnitrophota bacterium]
MADRSAAMFFDERMRGKKHGSGAEAPNPSAPTSLRTASLKTGIFPVYLWKTQRAFM